MNRCAFPAASHLALSHGCVRVRIYAVHDWFVLPVVMKQINSTSM